MPVSHANNRREDEKLHTLSNDKKRRRTADRRERSKLSVMIFQ